MIPMNLMKNKKAGYIVTGQWAKKAYQEAKIYGEAIELASSADKTFLIFLTAQTLIYRMIVITYIYVRTTQSTVPSIRRFRIPRDIHW